MVFEMRLVALARSQGDASAVDLPALWIEDNDAVVAAGRRQLRALTTALLGEGEHATHIFAAFTQDDVTASNLRSATSK